MNIIYVSVCGVSAHTVSMQSFWSASQKQCPLHIAFVFVEKKYMHIYILFVPFVVVVGTQKHWWNFKQFARKRFVLGVSSSLCFIYIFFLSIRGFFFILFHSIGWEISFTKTYSIIVEALWLLIYIYIMEYQAFSDGCIIDRGNRWYSPMCAALHSYNSNIYIYILLFVCTPFWIFEENMCERIYLHIVNHFCLFFSYFFLL